MYLGCGCKRSPSLLYRVRKVSLDATLFMMQTRPETALAEQLPGQTCFTLTQCTCAVGESVTHTQVVSPARKPRPGTFPSLKPPGLLQVAPANWHWSFTCQTSTANPRPGTLDEEVCRGKGACQGRSGAGRTLLTWNATGIKGGPGVLLKYIGAPSREHTWWILPPEILGKGRVGRHSKKQRGRRLIVQTLCCGRCFGNGKTGREKLGAEPH